MVAVALFAWGIAGLAGLHLCGVSAARGPAAWMDNVFAIALGPFSILLAFLSLQFDPQADEESMDR